MKTINVPFEKDEYETLMKGKGEMTWRELINRSAWFMGILHREPNMEFGKNWEIDPPIKIEKPCHFCGYCPYGQLVEGFPIQEGESELSCEVFGHDCPAFYTAEPFAEDMKEDE